ncbi:tyrosine-type recombinase/integrase [Sediminibacterium sp.]|uniref:tyrosine-type recombinase/integrase n=1 Tax=Sediminibacterium sp. TaxID=1917865 RepID=UPI003F705B4A
MKQKFCSMRIYINTLKKSKVTQKYPMYLKLVYCGKKVEIRLPETFDATDKDLFYWDKHTAQFTHKQKDVRNTDLMELQVRFDKYMRNNNNTLRHPLKELMSIVLDKANLYKNWTVESYCDYYIKNRVIGNVNRVKGTQNNYIKAVNHLKKFLLVNNLSQLPIDSFKYKEAVDFEMYMGNVAKNIHSSTSTNIIRLRTIFYEAIKEDLITKNPFKDLKLTYKGMKKTPSITIDQLKDIISNVQIQNDNRLKFYCDLFFFGCLTGLSVSNISSLSYGALFKIFNDRIKLDTSRVKTNVIIVQIIPTAAQKIIERYGTKNNQTDGKVFPSFSADDFREKLKLIAAYAKLNINLTTKISRTTCNQMLINVGGIDPIYKNAYMGWSSSSNIQDLYTSLEENVLLKYTSNIDDYLLNSLGNDYLNRI